MKINKYIYYFVLYVICCDINAMDAIEEGQVSAFSSFPKIMELAHLTNATTIDLSDCIITDAGLAHLTNATWIDLRGCYEITNKAKETLRQRGVEIIG